MAEPFIGEIRAVGFNFAPRGWAHCNGQLLPISQNTALFSIVGTIYGGDGRTTFGLPNLQGRAALGEGQGPGLSIRSLGSTGGVDQVTLSASQMPAHNHAMVANNGPASTGQAAAGLTLARARGGNAYDGPPVDNPVAMAAESIGPQGGGLPHNNLMPYQVVNFVIALVGIYPSRS